MASTGQIIRNNMTKMNNDERVKEFFEIIRPLVYETIVECDNGIYMKPKYNDKKGVRVWVGQEDYPIYTINGKKYYREVFFDFIWDDERHGIESMNSDMVLAIVAEYMKKYPDALFDYEWNNDDYPFWDKSDIEAVISQPFRPRWYYDFKPHLRGKTLKCGEWILE